MKFFSALAALSIASAIIPVDRLAAQGGRDLRDDGAAARSDAILGTPNRTTPVPQTNMFSTSPGLEQQTPASPPAASQGAGSGQSSDQGASSDKSQRAIRP
jgi:hypothetical protein